MDSLETQPLPQPDLEELKEQLASLKQLVHSLLVVLIMISGTLNIYLLRQYKFNKTDLASVRPQAEQIAADYNKNVPAMTNFLGSLAEYGRTHPDFGPIAAKYHLTGPAVKTGSVPGAEPATTNPKK